MTEPKVLAKTKRKAPRFVRDYIESGFNGAEAARRNFDIDMTKENSTITAAVIGNEYLNKPYYKKTLEEALENKLNDDDIGKIIRRNAKQNKNLPASNAAVDMAIKVKGGYAPEKRANYNLNMSDKDLDTRLEELEEEMKRLKLLDAPQ